jgi:FkbM family methyltransferase
MNRALKRSSRTYHAAPTAFGFTVDGDTADLIQRYLYVFGVWEPDISHWLQQHLQPGDVVLDVGANIGYFSLLAGACVGPAGRVIAFEAVPSIADMLERNVRRNGLPVDVRRTAAGDVPGSIEIFRSSGRNLGRSGTSGGAGTTSEGAVPVVRVADVVEHDLWPRIRFVKIDVEGDERRVLRGLEPVLRALPVGAAVLTEVTPVDLAARSESAEELMGMMRGLGFAARSVRNSYAAADYAHYVRQHPVPLAGTPTSQTDVLFVKEET